MLPENQIIELNNLLSQGRGFAKSEPTATIKRQQILDARKQVMGSGLLDLATESLIQNTGANIGAELGKLFGLRSSAGRKIGMKTGSNIAQQARANRLLSAEKNAINEFECRRRNWEMTTQGWLGEARRLLSSVYQNPGPGVRNRSMGEHLQTKLHSTGSMTGQLRSTLHIVEQIVRNSQYYISKDEWNAYQAAKKVNPTTLIKKGEIGKGFDLVQRIINRAQKKIDWQDAYADVYNLILLKCSAKTCVIRMLMGGQKPIDSDFMAVLRELHGRGYKIEVRRTGSDTPFHDRLLISENEIWQIGTSANGLGSRDTTVVQLKDISDIRERFDEHWSKASKINF
jgi:hypothetical protein